MEALRGVPAVMGNDKTPKGLAQGGGFRPINMRTARYRGVEKDSLGDSLKTPA
jgi:hypothetical protein